MKRYIIVSDMGEREWYADSFSHALEQHHNAFGDSEKVITVIQIEVGSYWESFSPYQINKLGLSE